MSMIVSDQNKLLLMMTSLKVMTKILKDYAKRITLIELEGKWIAITESFTQCISYAQKQDILLFQYKDDLAEIMTNMYEIEIVLKERNDHRSSINSHVQTILVVADKLDDVLVGFGFKRIIRPITEVVFGIFQAVGHMVSQPSSNILPSPQQTLYLPSQDAIRSSVPTTVESIVNHQVPTCSIEDIWQEHNVLQKKYRGIKIRVQLVTENLRNYICRTEALFFSESELPLRDVNGQYQSQDGNVGVYIDFEPQYDKTRYRDIQLFMPYEELHISNHSILLKFKVQFFVYSLQRIIATSDTQQFRLNW